MKFSSRRIRGVLPVLFGLIILSSSVLLSAQINPDLLAGLKARSIGPANMSGRIGAIDAVASDPNVIYVGAAAGGVWKSTDGGVTWNPVFDDQPVASIGAICIFQKNPNIVWVGTGEAAPRNSVSVGRGVYLSLDAGKTWKAMGLEKTEKISKILIHPDNPDIVYVAALGPTWGDGAERGVFMTEDGGKTWEKTLHVDARTGASDLAMDPSNPRRILAGMWEHRRWPWFFVSGGPGSGLFLTTDGGLTWEKQTTKNGLPAGDLGRIGLAFAPGRPQTAYALVEATRSVLLRSADGGENWQVVNDTPNFNNRPFYYNRIWVNPANENIVYMLHGRLMASEDGGKTFQSLTSSGQSHVDFHALWIDPSGELLIQGNDGGVVISRNRGRTWRFAANLPLGQYYHVTLDNEYPYNAYGGLQDNGTWRGPAYSLRGRSIGDYDWISVGGGDGFDAAADPENPNCGYGMSQGGNLYYFDITTGTSRSCVPPESDVKHRYNWNSGFAVDPFRPATIYLGSQFVHRSPDKGRTWEIISPDLTTNNPEKLKQSESGGLTLDVTNAENHCTILAVAPSPIKKGKLWVGTDDGNIALTRDGGENWEFVSTILSSGRKPLVPAGAAVPHIEPSRFDEAAAYAVFDDHRRSNFTPYVFVTRDDGRTWKSLVTPDIDGYCFVIKEDPVNRNLLFLGTEFGLFVSLDGGGSWMKWTHGLPTCPVYDLAIHPRENDLVIATHGRSLYVLDDITPLREISAEIAKNNLHLFSIPDARLFQQGRMSPASNPGDGAFIGKNKPFGACISYHLIPSEKKPEKAAAEPSQEARSEAAGTFMTGGQRPAGMPPAAARSRSRVSVTILDEEGRFISRLDGTEHAGLNRVFWDFRETEAPGGPEEEARAAAGSSLFFGRWRGGITALPGTYTAKVKYEDQEASGTFKVLPDPRLEVDLAVLKANHEQARKAQDLGRIVLRAGRQIQQTRQALQTVRDGLRTARNPRTAELLKAAESLERKIVDLAETLNPTPAKQGMADRSASLSMQVMRAVMGISSAGYEPVSEATQVRLEKVKPLLAAFVAKYNDVYQKDVEEFKKELREADFSLFGPFRPLKIE
ncbi:MAG: hypothetical protein JW747_03140 [Candidatus Aminicenantes bacterium]|nr:hypothetical protein [Candidatus Aminicenantes bacterium]